MAEYIEREAVINYLRECEGTPPELGYTYPIYKEMERFVGGLPAADAAPVVHGRWEHHENGTAYCSECEMDAVEDGTDYCPNCGAKMDAELLKGGDTNEKEKRSAT